MNYRLILCAPFLSLWFSSAFGQSPLEADAEAYRYDSSHAEIEIDYGVLQRALAFTPHGNGFTAITSAKAEIWQNGAVAQRKEIHDTVQCPCTQAQLDSASANKLLGAAGFAVPYVSPTTAAFIWQRGIKDGKAVFDTIVIPLNLPSKDSTKFSFGSVELSSSVAKSSGNPSPFEKSGYIVTPNPSGIFGENYTKLYYYTELYVPANSVDPAQKADIVTSVIDASGKQIVSSTEKVQLTGPAVPLILGLDIDGLPGDSYRLRIQAKYEDAIVAEIEKPFFYASEMKLSEDAPPPPASLSNDSILFAESDFMKMSEPEADERIDQSKYWMGEADQNAAKKLKTLADKQRFLFTFWRSEDEKLHSAQPLDAYRLFMGRVTEANKEYNYQKTPGWKTGRGRVLITYGPPKRIGTVAYDPAYKPYIVWQYDPDPNIRLKAGTFPEFDFVDRMGGGNYFLVSSNVIGENYDVDWMTHEALRLAH